MNVIVGKHLGLLRRNPLSGIGMASRLIGAISKDKRPSTPPVQASAPTPQPASLGGATILGGGGGL